MSTNTSVLRVYRIQAYWLARRARLPSDLHFTYTDHGVRCDCGAMADKAQHLQHTSQCAWLTRRNATTRAYIDAVQAWREAFRNERVLYSSGTDPARW